MFFVALKIVTYVRKKIIITVRNSRCGKVMFSQVCVNNSDRGGTCVAVGACVAGQACMVGGVHGRGCAWQGVCMAGGVHGRGCAWQGGM